MAFLDTLIPQEVEAETMLGRWFTTRFRPSRTLDNVKGWVEVE